MRVPVGWKTVIHSAPSTTSTRAGRYRRSSASGGEEVWAFGPSRLPPSPPLALSGALAGKLGRAMHALGRLDAVGSLLPDPGLFLYMYVRKEAVLSSQIEGTQSSLSDLLLHEAAVAPGVPIGDVEETSAYVHALGHGGQGLRRGGRGGGSGLWLGGGSE